ncbi:MAG: hypothetical protein AAF502_25695 [Bacteroidota bacterium]
MAKNESIRVLKNDQLTIRINDLMKRAVVKLAQKEKVSVGELVNEWIRQGVIREYGGKIEYKISLKLSSN